MPVSPDDVGKRLLVEQLINAHATGTDSQYTVFAFACDLDGNQFMSFESWPGYTNVAQGDSVGLSVWPAQGWAYDMIPAGTAYILLQLQLRHIRNGDNWTVFTPLVNIV